MTIFHSAESGRAQLIVQYLYCITIQLSIINLLCIIFHQNLWGARLYRLQAQASKHTAHKLISFIYYNNIFSWMTTPAATMSDIFTGCTVVQPTQSATAERVVVLCCPGIYSLPPWFCYSIHSTSVLHHHNTAVYSTVLYCCDTVLTLYFTLTSSHHSWS